MSETFFTADLHLGHEFMADHRGFGHDHVDRHDEAIIEGWNSVVGRRDTVYMLGDFTFHRSDDSPRYFARLNGKKHLVVGNHDPRHVVDLPWSSRSEILTRRFAGHGFVMCHYPFLTWLNAHHGSWHLHGHSHGQLQAPLTTRLDVGVDCHPERRPFSLDEIVEILSSRSYGVVDHHERDEVAS